jgi:hypothetical protein
MSGAVNHLSAIAASGSGWLPKLAASATLVGQYEVRADLVTVSTGGVAEISNRVVGGADPLLQSMDASQRPDFEAAGWGAGGADSVIFNGTTDAMTAHGIAAAVTGTDVAFSIVMVAQIVTLGSAAGNRTIWGFGRTSTDTPVFDFRLPSSTTDVGNVTHRDDSNTVKSKNMAAALTTARHTYSHVYNGTKIAAYVDGVLDGNLDGVHASNADLDLGVTTLDTFTVGALTRTGTAAQTNLRLGGMLVFSGALSSGDRLQAEKYLKRMHPL